MSPLELQIPSCVSMAMAMAENAHINGHNVPAAAPTPAVPPALEMVTFSAIMDDIIFPDGRASRACLGGGGPQTAFGALLWCWNGERVGLASGVGADFPDLWKKWLENVGVDIGGLVLWACPTPRVWHLSEPLDGSIQNLEDDHIQAEIQRLSGDDSPWEMLLPELNVLPPLYQKAKTYHVAVPPSGLAIGFLRTLRSGAAILSVEVFGLAEDVVPHPELQALVSVGHIFSPNEREAVSLVGAGTPLELIERLSKLGAEIVVLRRGHLGSIVHRSDTKETWDVPAFHTLISDTREENGDLHMTELEKASLEGMDVKAIVDPTGCGNSFCGGFLVGWNKTRNLLTAGLWGSVSASFMLEYEGLPPPLVSQWRTVTQRRLGLLQPHVKQISFH